MEPKPRGISEEELGIATPQWLTEAAKDYKKAAGSSYTETSFFRGNGSIEILDRILPEISHRPNILLVGLGLDTEPLICCYEPFRIGAHLEGKSVDYTMTLVDVDNEVIEDIRGRTRLFLSCRQYEDGLRKSFERTWNKYLADTHQEGTETTKRENGLRFCSYLEKDGGWTSYKTYLEHGILVANVSPVFRTKLARREVCLIQEDIAVADLKGSGPFDYVECTNVLYLMSANGQKLALANIARSMAGNGRLLINDIGGYVGRPVFTRLGGWLDEEKLEQLGLKIEEMTKVKDTSQTAVLRKVGHF